MEDLAPILNGDPQRAALLEARIFGTTPSSTKQTQNVQNVHHPNSCGSSNSGSLPATMQIYVNGSSVMTAGQQNNNNQQPLLVQVIHSPVVTSSAHPVDLNNILASGSTANNNFASRQQLPQPVTNAATNNVSNLHNQQNLHSTAQHSETSNVSSAGSSGDPDSPEKANLLNTSSVHNRSLPVTLDLTGEPPNTTEATPSGKPKRKRKTKDGAASGGGDSPVSSQPKPKTPKCDRKISEFFVGKTSPVRGLTQSLPGPTAIGTPPNPAFYYANQQQSSAGQNSVNFLSMMPTQPTTVASSSSVQNVASASSTPISHESSSMSSQITFGRVHVIVQTDLTMKELENSEQVLKTALDKKSARLDHCEKEVEELRNQTFKQERKLDDQAAKLMQCREMAKRMLIDQSSMERKQRRAKVMENRLRLGQFVTERRGAQFEEVWQDGYAFTEINKKLQQINLEKEDIARSSQTLRKRKPTLAGPSSTSKKQTSTSGLSAAIGVVQLSCSNSNDGFAKPEVPKELSPQEYYEQDEIYRLRKEQLKKEESELQQELDRLDRERNLHMRELKRVQNEDQSRYKEHLTLSKRYLLLSLLGKGGFSEVWRAFDLEENRYVGCKIHHVNKDWKEEKKANYVKHALREKDIHKALDHPRIVKLYDVFTIDVNSFCTVLEYCGGNDLDFYLKQNKCIPEKEARSMIMQVVSALRYLNEIKPPVIHYDLKPANILLSTGTASGEIKITDFGLSKRMEDDKYDPQDGMDLTSQGAGTYWYLPPECFIIRENHQPPKINSKVDIWSVGVIFYQCLYGRRPFGHDMSQQRILEENTILKATEVNFPNKPSVSKEAKDFIKCCLQYKKEERADVFALYTHEYLKPKNQKNQPSASGGSAPGQSSGTATGSGNLIGQLQASPTHASFI